MLAVAYERETTAQAASQEDLQMLQPLPPILLLN